MICRHNSRRPYISKVNHEPLTFLHVPADPQWVRVNGLASAADVVKEYRQLLAE